MKIVLGKSGSAGDCFATPTLTSHAVWRYIDEVRHVKIQLHIVIPRTPWLTPFVLFEENCMSAALTDEKRGRRASQAARKTNKM